MSESKKLPVCVVVGLGAQGIGDHCAQKWAAEGYAVAMLARTESKLAELEQSIPNSKAYRCDATSAADVDAAVAAITTDLGPIEVLVYNAGAGMFKEFDKTSFEEFEVCWRTGPAGLFLFAKAVLPGMVARGAGFVAVTGATAAWRGAPKTPAFAPAKFAVRALAQSLAKDYGPKGIHVFHCVIDGVVSQPRTKSWFSADKPAHEFLSPDTIAQHYFDVSKQPPTCWTFESNVVPGSRMFDMLTI